MQEGFDFEKQKTQQAKALHDFFCGWFKVPSADQIRPFARWPVASHTIMREVVLTVETTVSFSSFKEGVGGGNGINVQQKFCTSPQPRDPFRSPVNGKPLAANLNCLYINSYICRHVEHSNLQGPMGIRLAKQPQVLNKIQMGDETDHSIKAAGGVPGVFLCVQPSTPSPFDPAIGPILDSPVNNLFNNMTFPPINERNILNGLVQVPFDVCKAAGLPVSLEPPKPNEAFLKSIKDLQSREQAIRSFQEQIHASALKEGKQLNTHFIAIPFGHVLTWILRSEEAAAAKGIKMYYFKVKNRQEQKNILFYLVSNNDFERMLASFKHSFFDKMEARSLNDLQLECVPLLPFASAEGSKLLVRSYISYTAPPLNEKGEPLSQMTIDNLAPTLPPSIPSPDNWL